MLGEDFTHDEVHCTPRCTHEDIAIIIRHASGLHEISSIGMHQAHMTSQRLACIRLQDSVCLHGFRNRCMF